MEIPGYRGPEEVHRGHRCLVLRARRISDGRAVVLKTVTPGPGNEPAAAVLRHEHRMLASLAGIPGVVVALALEENAGLPLLVLEDAGPVTLADHLDRRPMELGAFLPLAVRLAETVAALHARGVVHRDVNPLNVVLDASRAQATLVDFGTATTLAGVSSDAELTGSGTLAGTLAGTLPYMAPEQTGRMGRVVDHRADLYALGATYYQMLTGAPPFTSADPVELVHAHLARPPVPLIAVDPRVPVVLSDLVLKLLAKTPEERYQSAGALAADLRQALAAWRSAGRLATFQLARGDLAPVVAERLHGRERELGALRTAHDRATAGDNRLILIEGPAGIGKSALVFGFARGLADPRVLVSGKCEQFPGDVPYPALVEAFRRVARGWLDGPAAERGAWRAPLLEALGRNASVIAELIPELRTLLGELPPAAALGPVEAERRFQLTFSQFVRALAARLRPLCLFIDDLQWADPASLKLLGLLATDPDIRHLLLIAACRTEDVGPEHPLTRALDEVRAAGGTVSALPLAPLDDAAVTDICVDTLRSQPSEVEALGRLVRRLTGGNAFFVQRFLLHLHQAGLLRWDPERRHWAWDAAAIERAELTDDVLGLMLESIRRLPAATQRLLETAACFRRRVDLALLAALVGEPIDQIAGELVPAIHEGLLVPDAEAGDDRALRPGVRPAIRYRFVHDRVQQAAYLLLDAAGRTGLHLALGRLLLDRLPAPADSGRAEALFEVVDQLRPAQSLITDPAERARLADLCAEAGERAQAASAYGPALAYLTAALELRPPPDADATEAARRFPLHRQAMQLAYLTGDRPAAERHAQAGFALAGSAVEAAELDSIQIVDGSMRGAYPEAITRGREALARLGMELPAPADRGRLGGPRPEDLLDLPRMRDAKQLAGMQLMANMLDPAYVCDPGLLVVLVERMVELSLAHGNCVHSAFAYTVYGMIVASRDGDYRSGHAFGTLGVNLARAFGDPVQECRALHIFATFVNHWRAPVASSLPRLRLAVARALEGGDLHYGVYADYTAITVDLHRGAELGQVAGDLENAFALTRKIRVGASLGYLTACRQTIRALQGRTRARGQFDDDGFDQQAFLAAHGANPIALWLYQVLRLQVAYLLGDLPEAALWAERAEPLRPLVGPVLSLVDHTFYRALVRAGAADSGNGATPAEARARTRELLAEDLRQLETWARNCPENFRHKQLLLAAEMARLAEDEAAAELYDQAIDGAQRESFLHDCALASELAGRYHRGLGRRRIGDFYLRAAMEGFARWGAPAKVAALEEEFPHLAELPWRAPLPTVGADGKALDLLSLLKAAGTISSEVVLERLIERLLTICFEVGGAARGALLLEQEGGLTVRALGALGGGLSLEGTPLALSRDVPRRMIEHAHRTGEVVVLGEAWRQGAAPADPYLREHKVKSALALPIRHQTRAIGVLYLENNLVPHTFTAARLRVLTLLSSQMAISLENSLLFGKLNSEIEVRRRAEAKAQESVQARDEFLSIAAHELKTPLTSLTLALQVLAQETDRGGNASQVQLAQVGERQARRLQDLIEDLLDVSRVRAGKLQLSYEDVDLVKLVRGVIDGFTSQLAEARCPVELRVPGEAGAEITGRWSRARLEQVVVNLISNALKFGRGKPIEIEVGESGNQVTITVIDHGIGIPSDRLPHIFERFERAVSTAHYGGLGLGLYIAREIAVALGGAIRADSQLGVGSTFVVTLPRRSDRAWAVGPGRAADASA